MDKLKNFIRESRNWSSVARGGELFTRAASVIERTLGIDAGFIIYKRHLFFQDNLFVAYNPWGLEESAEELTRRANLDNRLFDNNRRLIRESWLCVEDINPLWRDIWIRNDIMKVGYFPIIARGEIVGGIILGRRTGDFTDDAETLSLCAMQLSLLLEMLSTRRLAEYNSNHDPLTDILNRRGFVKFLDVLDAKTRSATARSAKGGRGPAQGALDAVAVVNADHAPNRDNVSLDNASFLIGTLDVDDFKVINDTYGHSHGDEVLKDIANTLQDFVQDAGCCARFGGDEFLFVLPTSADLETVEREIASRFTNQSYTISVGCAKLDLSVGWEVSYNRADQRLYENKRALAQS